MVSHETSGVVVPDPENPTAPMPVSKTLRTMITSAAATILTLFVLIAVAVAYWLIDKLVPGLLPLPDLMPTPTPLPSGDAEIGLGATPLLISGR